MTVAVLDGNIDFLLPEFQVARNVDGTETRKVVDVLSGRDPMGDDSPQWVSMERSVVAENRKGLLRGRDLDDAAGRVFRIGVFDTITSSPSYVVSTSRTVMNRPGSRLDVDRPIGVLWDEKTNEVRVDANQDFSFADEKPMRDFHERYDSGLIGTDDPDTPVLSRSRSPSNGPPRGVFVNVNVGMYRPQHDGLRGRFSRAAGGKGSSTVWRRAPGSSPSSKARRPTG